MMASRRVSISSFLSRWFVLGSLPGESRDFNPEIRPFPGGAQEWKWRATVSEGPVAAASQVRGLRNNSDEAQIQTCCGWALPQPRSGHSQRDCVLHPRLPGTSYLVD